MNDETQKSDFNNQDWFKNYVDYDLLIINEKINSKRLFNFKILFLLILNLALIGGAITPLYFSFNDIFGPNKGRPSVWGSSSNMKALFISLEFIFLFMTLIFSVSILFCLIKGIELNDEGLKKQLNSIEYSKIYNDLIVAEFSESKIEFLNSSLNNKKPINGNQMLEKDSFEIKINGQVYTFFITENKKMFSIFGWIFLLFFGFIPFAAIIIDALIIGPGDTYALDFMGSSLFGGPIKDSFKQNSNLVIKNNETNETFIYKKVKPDQNFGFGQYFKTKISF